MARPFTGNDETVEIAQIAITQAKTLDELRQAQAVLLPLLYGLSLKQTAQVIGVSLGALLVRAAHLRLAGANARI